MWYLSINHHHKELKYSPSKRREMRTQLGEVGEIIKILFTSDDADNIRMLTMFTAQQGHLPLPNPVRVLFVGGVRK